MKTFLYTFICLGFFVAIPAVAGTYSCEGTVTVNNVGQISTKVAKLTFSSATSAIYAGPHASILLGSPVQLEFQSVSSGNLFADYSTQGHGGELNRFYVNSLSQNKIEFSYRGSYGYFLKGILACK